MSKITRFFYKDLPISFELIDESPDKKVYLSKNVFVHLDAPNILYNFSNTSRKHYNIAVHVAEFDLHWGMQHLLLSGEGDSEIIDYEKSMIEGSLRLVKPLPISYLGCMRLEGSELTGYGAGKHKSIINWTEPCPYQRDEVCEYNKKDLELVYYLTDFFPNNRSLCKRLEKIVYYFMHKDIWENLCRRDTVFQGFFAALDALSLNTLIHHNKIVSSNLGKWLNHIYPEATTRGVDFTQLILRLWDSYRGQYAHCSISCREPSIHYTRSESGEYTSIDKMPNDILEAPMVLHEIVRLILLSIIFLPRQNREDFINFPLVDNHKAPKYSERKERKNQITQFFDDLVSKNIKPSELFWEPKIHNEMFSNFLNPSTLQNV